MAFIWRPENDGQPLHLTPNDLGGSTAWGTTFTTWAAWQRLHNAPVSMDAFKALAQSDFLPLYRTLFWNASRCGNLGPIGIQIFDAAMGSGPGNAGMFLQHVLRAIGSPYTGNAQIGPAMVAAVNNCVPAVLNLALCTERERFYATLPTAKYFERGWDRRAEACRDLVAGLINGVSQLSAKIGKLPPTDIGIPITEQNQSVTKGLVITTIPSADDLNNAELAQLNPGAAS